MTPESRQRRIAYLEKILSKRKQFTFRQDDTDRAFIRRRMFAATCVLVYFGFGIFRGVDRHWFRADSHLVSGFLIPIGILLFTAGFLRFVIKSHWALKVLDHHKIDSLYQLPEETPAPPAGPAS